jgi:hypothetical protein
MIPTLTHPTANRIAQFTPRDSVLAGVRELAMKELGPVWHILYAPPMQRPGQWKYQDLVLQRDSNVWTLEVKWVNTDPPNFQYLFDCLCIPPRANVQYHANRAYITWNEVEPEHISQLALIAQA